MQITRSLWEIYFGIRVFCSIRVLENLLTITCAEDVMLKLGHCSFFLRDQRLCQPANGHDTNDAVLIHDRQMTDVEFVHQVGTFGQ